MVGPAPWFQLDSLAKPGPAGQGPRRVRRQQVQGRLEALRGTAVELDDLAAQRGQDVAVCGVAGSGERDPVTGVEGGQEGQQEGTRRPGGETDLGRVDPEPVPAFIVTGDLITQRTDTEGLGIAESGVVGHQLRRPPPQSEGAPWEGSPAQSEITSRPAARSSATALRTVITANGGTVDRFEGERHDVAQRVKQRFTMWPTAYGPISRDLRPVSAVAGIAIALGTVLGQVDQDVRAVLGGTDPNRSRSSARTRSRNPMAASAPIRWASGASGPVRCRCQSHWSCLVRSAGRSTSDRSLTIAATSSRLPAVHRARNLVRNSRTAASSSSVRRRRPLNGNRRKNSSSPA